MECGGRHQEIKGTRRRWCQVVELVVCRSPLRKRLDGNVRARRQQVWVSGVVETEIRGKQLLLGFAKFKVVEGDGGREEEQQAAKRKAREQLRNGMTGARGWIRFSPVFGV